MRSKIVKKTIQTQASKMTTVRKVNNDQHKKQLNFFFYFYMLSIDVIKSQTIISWYLLFREREKTIEIN
jgi:hypothetical protein